MWWISWNSVFVPPRVNWVARHFGIFCLYVYIVVCVEMCSSMNTTSALLPIGQVLSDRLCTINSKYKYTIREHVYLYRCNYISSDFIQQKKWTRMKIGNLINLGNVNLLQLFHVNQNLQHKLRWLSVLYFDFQCGSS